MVALICGVCSFSVYANEHPALTLVKETTKDIKQKIKEQNAAIEKDQEVLLSIQGIPAYRSGHVPCYDPAHNCLLHLDYTIIQETIL